MYIQPSTIVLKDGRQALLRCPSVEDASALVDLLRTVYQETEYLMRYPEEMNITVEQEKVWIENNLSSPYTIMLSCEVEGKIVGNCQIDFNARLKTKHRASLAISIMQAFWGLGIGTAMFQKMEEEARKHDVSQLELEYIEGNQRGLALYQKMGFETVSYKPDAICLKDGTLLKEYFMIKKLRS